jgi:hypothetical protein
MLFIKLKGRELLENTNVRVIRWVEGVGWIHLAHDIDYWKW